MQLIKTNYRKCGNCDAL